MITELISLNLDIHCISKDKESAGFQLEPTSQTELKYSCVKEMHRHCMVNSPMRDWTAQRMPVMDAKYSNFQGAADTQSNNYAGRPVHMDRI